MIEKYKSLFEYKDGSLYWKVSTNSRVKAGDIAGTKDPRGYSKIRIDRKLHYVHRVIFAMHNNFLPVQVDHINGDKSDNRIENLRAANPSTNRMNEGVSAKNTSGVKGVNFCKFTKKWMAKITKNGILVVCKRFTNLKDAKSFIVQARNEIHGEFANHG